MSELTQGVRGAIERLRGRLGDEAESERDLLDGYVPDRVATYAQLTDLAHRLDRAAENLGALADAATPEFGSHEAARLAGKREGVLLARGYLHELQCEVVGW